MDDRPFPAPYRAGRIPEWRSVHFIPANVPRYVEKAAGLPADAFQIDLEDSVPADARQESRARVAAIAASLKRARPEADVLVRINRPLRDAVLDIESSVGPDVDALTIAKVDGASHVRLLDELVSACERERHLPAGHTAMMVVIETPRAFEAMDEIARASPRIVAMMLGTEDFALACGFAPTDEVMLMPKQRMVIAARSAGIAPLGYIGSIAGFRDAGRFREMVRRSRDFGFVGGTSIHPLQIPVLNEVYSPGREEIEAALAIVAANDEALSAKRGSFEADGRMVDAPIVERARRLLERARRLGMTLPDSPQAMFISRNPANEQ